MVEIDSSPLDLLVLNPYIRSPRKVVPMWLTVALDIYSRQLAAWRVTAGDPTGVDAALLLHDMLVPKAWDPSWGEQARWRYGVPEHLVVHGAKQNKPLAGVPFGVPGAISVDNGSIYASDTFRSACAQLGIDLHFARTSTPTDKPHVERFFRTVSTRFTQYLPGYRGSSTADRGTTQTVEGEAALFPEEVDSLFGRWVASEYHNTPHKGLPIAGVRGGHLSPNEAFDRAIAITGFYAIPTAPDLAVGLLSGDTRAVRREGIEINGLFYDSDDLNPFRRLDSPYAELKGQWPVRFDPRDLSWIWFFEPDDIDAAFGEWVPIPCRVARGERPFADVELKWAKDRLSGAGYDMRSGASVAPLEAELESVLDRIERNEPESIEEAEVAAIGRYRIRQAEKDGLHRLLHGDVTQSSEHSGVGDHQSMHGQGLDPEPQDSDLEAPDVSQNLRAGVGAHQWAPDLEHEDLLRPTIAVSTTDLFAQVLTQGGDQSGRSAADEDTAIEGDDDDDPPTDRA